MSTPKPSLYSLTMLAVILGLSLLASPNAALADDATIVTSFSSYDSQQNDHNDADPFKGWVDVTVTNNMSEAWGDFHFEILDIGYDVTNVDFIDTSPYEPTSSQSGLSWSIDNSAYGATMDLFFYSDPVLPTEVAQFKVYTDNTADNVPWFGVVIYPTPVPEPATIGLLGFGVLAVLARRKK